MIRLLDGPLQGALAFFFFLGERAHAEFLVYRAGGGTVTSSRFFERLLSGCGKGALKIFFFGGQEGETLTWSGF